MAVVTRCDGQCRQLIPIDWWRSSFRSISWTFGRSQQRPSRIPSVKPILAGSGELAKPPHYHDLLYRTSHRERRMTVSPADLELNPDLAGVRGVEQVIGPYEIDEGIRTLPERTSTESPELFTGDLDEDELSLPQKQWGDQMEALLGGVLERLSSSFQLLAVANGNPDRTWDFNVLDSPRSDTVELTDSETSVESDMFPITPRAGFALVPVQYTGSDHLLEYSSPQPSKPLNASAVSFIPSVCTPPPASSSRSSKSDLHSPSPSREFAFPSLCANNPAASPAAHRRSLLLQKDRDGFYHPIDGDSSSFSPEDRGSTLASTQSMTPSRASADLLPAFLADDPNMGRSRGRNTSRTREIVDRLRSGRWNGKKTASKVAGDKSAPGAAPAAVNKQEDDMDAVAKADRREGTLDTGSDVQTPSDADGWIPGPPSERIHVTEDGWIAGSSVPSSSPSNIASSTNTSTPARPSARSRGHRHKRSTSTTSSFSGSSSSASFSPATSVSSFGPHTPPSTAQPHFPPPSAMPVAPFPSAAVGGFAPPMAQAQYLQMQMHIQQVQVQQWQMHAPSLYYNPGGYSPYAVAPIPMPAQPVMYGAGTKGLNVLGVQCYYLPTLSYAASMDVLLFTYLLVSLFHVTSQYPQLEAHGFDVDGSFAIINMICKLPILVFLCYTSNVRCRVRALHNGARDESADARAKYLEREQTD
ncbi:uncharacterized protein LAESUDRAFT_715859 [Laetiporus sulphureus 93-53]|uniref:Uncharacterized protein n=1 Tax=Laetiporus sulphureus 93-53 TaxID=1314785 RepID=A0A165D162_9APHY|nr:uncharacterized protein LAESUDRAFT_715859 [Laetiporus sulphureus 93-53]KZT03933.1 hypothetical protein LAESUDRAFT_715859 [Laetiporus sulphureus 93-53]